MDGRSKVEDTICIHWQPVTIEGQEVADSTMVLYGYVTLEKNQIVYIGKADRSTVWERHRCRSKAPVWSRIYSHFGRHEKCFLIVGELAVPQGRRFSSALLSDVETLLISRLKPIGNRSAVATRISRPGTRVLCRGAWWPLSRRTFKDA